MLSFITETHSLLANFDQHLRLVGSWILTLLISWSKSYHILWFVLYIPMKKCHAPIVFPSKTMIFPLIYTWNGHFFPNWLPMNNETVGILDRSEPNFSIHRAVSAALASGRLYTFVYTYCTYILYICIMYQINLMTCICVAMILYNYIYTEREKELYCII